jgi:GAF domain-containing protein
VEADQMVATDPQHPRQDFRSVAVELQSLLLGADGIESFLADVATAGAGAVDRAQSCGVTVQATPTSRVMGATTDEFAQRMDDVQYAVNDGPCLTCLREGDPVLVADIRADSRWPAFARRGTQEGAGASLSVPMSVGSQTVGALNLYTRTANSLTDTDRTRAEQFAAQAAGAVALALRLAQREERERNLEAALSSRSVIDQAMGVLMAQARINADAAFDVLRRRSQTANVKLRDVAATVIAEATRPR